MKIQKSFIFLLLILILNYFGLIFIKYNQNELSILDFSVFTVGNFITIGFFIFIILAISYLYFFNYKVFANNLFLIYAFSLLMIIPLGLAYLTLMNVITFKDGYIWGYPCRKVMIGVFFVFNFSLSIFLAFIFVALNYKQSYYIYLKAFFFSTFMMVVILIFSFLFSTKYTDNLKMESFEKGKYDVGVILGAAVWKLNQPSPVLKGRIEKAFELYNKGIIKKIQVTGGKAPGELTEAEVAFRQLKKMGMPVNDILIETKTSTTSEQVKFIKRELTKNEKNDEIIIISDQFHLKRVLEICKFFNVNAKGVSSGVKFNFDKLLYYRIRESVALLLFWLFAI